MPSSSAARMVYRASGIILERNCDSPSQSLVNENINMFDSGGTSSSPALIAPTTTSKEPTPTIPQWTAITGAASTTDGTASDTAQTATAFNNIYNNQFIDTVNMGIEIGTGHDNAAYNNRVISAGLLPNGTQNSSQNVGLTLADVYGNIANGSMYNNNMYNNTVGWMCWAARCASTGCRNDQWFPLNSSYYGTNQSIWANPITLAMESTREQTWLAKISSNNMVVEPRLRRVPPAEANRESSKRRSLREWIGVRFRFSIEFSYFEYGVVHHREYQQHLMPGIHFGTRLLGPHCSKTLVAHRSHSSGSSEPAADSGYYQLVNRSASSASNKLVWDVTGGEWQTANQGTDPSSIPRKLRQTEEWMPVSVGNGAYAFVGKKQQQVPGCSRGFFSGSAPIATIHLQRNGSAVLHPETAIDVLTVVASYAAP